MTFYDISPIVIISHRRSGTHWSIDTIRNNLVGVGSEYYNLDRIQKKNKYHLSIDEFMGNVEKCNGIPVLKSHMASDFTPFSGDEKQFVQDLLANSKIIYIYRDGRDVLTSLYYYMAKFEPNLPSFSQFLKMKENFNSTYVNLNRVEYWNEHVSGWTKNDDFDVCTISYEDLFYRYNKTVHILADFLNIPIAPDGVRKVDLQKPNLIEKIMNKMNVYSLPSSAIAPRKGVVGDWMNCFSEEDLDFFNSIATELMVELNYYKQNR
ncbi:sulfotransferase domain-containing protein [Methanohalophilus mahii]|uniref:Sulfotransferase n=1 Tax=Methanohalophilus mahii (strain ATCC 35705 / DSM 5219 / SLP) TaxID=547558 RepID=D5E8W2_METMS|nr:sulfotransferase domain-containing protein [Methanohalophilus mahii]ADE35621.1 sulfotransferase [Methanohalophilus mahii DSM 5219]